MKAPVFEYIAATNLSEALNFLDGEMDIRILAGGQSLIAMLNMRFAHPDRLIDINGIKELSYIRERNRIIEIGAVTRQRDVEFSSLIKENLPLLSEAILNVGHRQTRNRGTVGGSLCQLDPSAEIPTVALAYDAQVTIQSKSRTRKLSMKDYIIGYMSPALEDGEMLVSLSLTPWPKEHGYSFLEFSRRHGDFAIASVAVMLLVDSVNVITRASITLGGTGSTAFRVYEAEDFLLNKSATESNFLRAAELCAAQDATSDALVPEWYRKQLVGVLTKRALHKAYLRCGDKNE